MAKVTRQLVVVPNASWAPTQVSEEVGLFNADATPISLAALTVQTADDILMTGYASGVAGDISPTDTINEALAKLEARIEALE